jgi:hypothetical protein
MTNILAGLSAAVVPSPDTYRLPRKEIVWNSANDVAFLLTVGRSTITPLSLLLSSCIGPLLLGQGSSLGFRPRAAADQIMLRAEMSVCPKRSLAHHSS